VLTSMGGVVNKRCSRERKGVQTLAMLSPTCTSSKSPKLVRIRGACLSAERQVLEKKRGGRKKVMKRGIKIANSYSDENAPFAQI